MTQPTDIVRGGTERNASTIELFFDLVYVFAITQVVGFIHGEPTFAGLGKGAFLLFVLWWTWSIYTWTTNWSGTASTKIRLFLLATMATTLVMAMAVPRAFDESSALFGTTFFAVRMLAAGLYWFDTRRGVHRGRHAGLALCIGRGRGRDQRLVRRPGDMGGGRSTLRRAQRALHHHRPR